ncbi:killer cell lectin-like receptor subfamily B member 1B allele C [Egretta garzetta]|uniref:killer cell lectin-like receptor subfamily B member 1B allele C n=1 Tax=Egretta garzetta TaxID=188379 RepID=UPI00163CC4AB|nr:killer cell lectin-like receptor subfamily B member 1B allele C [Egretta garzetta]
MGWTPRGTKCYWVTDRTNSWSKSREDCENRSAELLTLGDQDELAFVKGIVQKPRSYFWIGLFLPSPGQDWTWVNGSRLDRSRFQLGSNPRDEGKICGAIRGDRIASESCSSGLHWICQKEATLL